MIEKSVLNFSRNPYYFLYHWLWKTIDLLYPPVCSGCGKHASRWCDSCMEETIRLDNASVCMICGKLLKTQCICQACILSPPAFDKLVSWGIYKGPLRNAIHRFKYERDLGVGETFASYLIQMYNKYEYAADIITPVPLNRKRYAERGYNQSTYLALPVALAVGKPLKIHAISRIKETHPQFDLAVQDRWKNVKDAFISNEKIVQGKRILLIDDISTTGATINECAISLKKAGATYVSAISLSSAVLIN